MADSGVLSQSGDGRTMTLTDIIPADPNYLTVAGRADRMVVLVHEVPDTQLHQVTLNLYNHSDIDLQLDLRVNTEEATVIIQPRRHVSITRHVLGGPATMFLIEKDRGIPSSVDGGFHELKAPKAPKP